MALFLAPERGEKWPGRVGEGVVGGWAERSTRRERPLTDLPATSPPPREGEGASGEVAVLLAGLRRAEGAGLGAAPRPRNGGEVAR